MSKGGRYLRQAAPKKKGKGLMIALIVIAVLLVGVIGCGIWYYNYLLNLVTRPGSVEVPTMSDEELAEMLGTVPTAPLVAPEETVPVTTSPEETWPEVVSDENITNIMVVGQASGRVGEDYRLSDTMILCSINRETKTLTLTSFMRDMRVVVPEYAGHSRGFNRMNVCYHLGSFYTGEVKGSMEMLALAVEQNFGVHVDHTVEVDIFAFEKIIDILGGVDIELTEAEAEYMTNVKKVGQFQEGMNHLDGVPALVYARLRKIDDDFERTNRQRAVIVSLLKKMASMSILDVHELLKQVVPMVTTDMSNSEITNYGFELIPMLKDLNIVSQRIPFPNTYWHTNAGTEKEPNYVIDANLQRNGQLLRESIGLAEATE